MSNHKDPEGMSGPQRSQSSDQPEASTSAPSQPLDYQQLYEQVKNKPCTVAHIEQRLEGHQEFTFRTRSSIIERELAPVYQASTLAEVYKALETAGQNLQHLDVFRDINFLVHEAPSVSMKELLAALSICSHMLSSTCVPLLRSRLAGTGCHSMQPHVTCMFPSANRVLA